MTLSPKPYNERSAISRWWSCWKTKQLIDSCPEGRGIFSSVSPLPTSEDQQGKDGEVDFVQSAHIRFLSKAHADKRWWYKAEIRTLEYQAMITLEEEIMDGFEKILKEKGYSQEDLFSAPEKQEEMQKSLAGVEGILGQDGSLSIWGYSLYRIRKITPSDWENLPIELGVRVDRTSHEGISLAVVLEEESLTRESVSDFVRKFWSTREQGYQQAPNWSGRREVMEMLVSQAVEHYEIMGRESRESGLII